MLATVLACFVFAIVAGLACAAASWYCARIEPFPDGPKTGTPPALAMTFGTALVGAYLAARGTPWPVLGGQACFAGVLIALWYCDYARGILPDLLTLPALAIAVVVGLIQHHPGPLMGAAFLFIPFAIPAMMSKGMGMGWGDAKLAALGGAALGMVHAAIAVVAACIVAVVLMRIKNRMNDYFAYGPYLACAFCLALAAP